MIKPDCDCSQASFFFIEGIFETRACNPCIFVMIFEKEKALKTIVSSEL